MQASTTSSQTSFQDSRPKEKNVTNTKARNQKHSGTSGISDLQKGPRIFPASAQGQELELFPRLKLPHWFLSPVPTSGMLTVGETDNVLPLNYQTPRSSHLNKNTAWRQPVLTARSFLAAIDAEIVTSSHHRLWTEGARKVPQTVQAYIKLLSSYQ